MLDIRDFGNTDSTGTSSSAQALQNAINAAVNINPATGLPIFANVNAGVDGTVYVPPGMYLIDKQILIPSTLSGSQYGQRALRIAGAVSGSPGTSLNPYGQSILKMSFGSRYFSDATFSSGSNSLLSSSQAQFTQNDVGSSVVGIGIPPGTVLTAVTNATTATMSQNATANGTIATVNNPKILSIGRWGTLFMEHLTLMGSHPNAGANLYDTAPFIQTLTTQLRLSDVYFTGTGNPRNVPNATVTANSTTLTAPATTFSQFDVGAPVYITVSGAAVPPGTYIQSVTNDTTAIMSNAATQTASGTASAYILSSFQDAIILGGTGQGTSPNNLQFSGYNSVIEKCTFDYIRRAAFFRAAANAITFRDNAIHNSCAGGPNEGAIDIDGAPSTALSNLISGNVVEISWYANGIRMNSATDNVLIGNYVGDGTAAIGSLSYHLTTASSRNLVLGGYYDGSSFQDDTPGANSNITTNTAPGGSILSRPLFCGPCYPLQVPLTVQTTSGSTWDLTQWYVGAAIVARVFSTGAVQIGPSTSATAVPLTLKGASGQTADLQEWQNSAGTPLSKVGGDGRLYVQSPNAAPTDSNLGNSQITFWLNEAGNQLTFRARYSGGTLKTGTVTLT